MATKTPLPYSERLKIVRERIQRARRSPRFEPIPKSAKVLVAEKTLAAWDRMNDRAAAAHYEKHRAKVRAIENAMIRGDAEEVIRLLTALEEG